MSGQNSSFAGTQAPNSSVCGMPQMDQPISDDHLAYGLLREKLYLALDGKVGPAELFSDITQDGSVPKWLAITSLLKPEDQRRPAVAHAMEEPHGDVSVESFAKFVEEFNRS